MPGGFEFGGIGRVMLYVTQVWARTPMSPVWRSLDPRGKGALALMPLHLLATIATVLFHRATGRLDLLHLNVAGRGSTLRKVVLAELARLLRLDYLVHLHDYDYAEDFAARRPAGQYLVRRLFRGAERVLVLGARDRATVVEMLGVPPERVELLPNGVPDPGVPPDRAGRKAPTRLLFLGHLDDRKGVPQLLEALSTPEMRNRSWTLVMAGGGEQERFAAMIQDVGLTGRITLAGWLSHDRIYALCREADIFVLPSHAEGQAMSLLEAMAHGLAVVTTPVGAHPETVAHEQEALLVPPGDPGHLREALARLIDDGDLRARLGRAARERYLTSFTVDRVADRLAAIYGTTAKPAPLPDLRVPTLPA
jgi:glycosyltransferase involved in cell wall biosynthesis